MPKVTASATIALNFLSSLLISSPSRQPPKSLFSYIFFSHSTRTPIQKINPNLLPSPSSPNHPRTYPSPLATGSSPPPPLLFQSLATTSPEAPFSLLSDSSAKQPVIAVAIKRREVLPVRMRRVGDFAFKAFTAGFGVATLYLTATFSINVYRGLSWHSAQSKLEKEKAEE